MCKMVFRRKFSGASVDISSFGGREPGSWGQACNGDLGTFCILTRGSALQSEKKRNSLIFKRSLGRQTQDWEEERATAGSRGRRQGRRPQKQKNGERAGRRGSPWGPAFPRVPWTRRLTSELPSAREIWSENRHSRTSRAWLSLGKATGSPTGRALLLLVGPI